MSTVDEYHKYARDCHRWAARARTEEQQKQFLSLAHDCYTSRIANGGGLEEIMKSRTNFAHRIDMWNDDGATVNRRWNGTPYRRSKGTPLSGEF
jgi:hypothetical protein